MSSTVVGGAMLPHAPQFFTMPDTEDRNTVERVRGIAADVGEKRLAWQDEWSCLQTCGKQTGSGQYWISQQRAC